MADASLQHLEPDTIFGMAAASNQNDEHLQGCSACQDQYLTAQRLFAEPSRQSPIRLPAVEAPAPVVHAQPTRGPHPWVGQPHAAALQPGASRSHPGEYRSAQPAHLTEDGGDPRIWWLIGGGVAVAVAVVVVFLLVFKPFAGDAPSSEEQPSEASAAAVDPSQAAPPAAAGSQVPDGTLSTTEVGNERFTASLEPSQPGRDRALDELMRKVRVKVTDDMTTARITLQGTPAGRTVSKVKIGGTAMKPGENEGTWSAKVDVRPGSVVVVVMGTQDDATEYRGRVAPRP